MLVAKSHVRNPETGLYPEVKEGEILLSSYSNSGVWLGPQEDTIQEWRVAGCKDYICNHMQDNLLSFDPPRRVKLVLQPQVVKVQRLVDNKYTGKKEAVLIDAGKEEFDRIFNDDTITALKKAGQSFFGDKFDIMKHEHNHIQYLVFSLPPEYDNSILAASLVVGTYRSWMTHLDLSLNPFKQWPVEEFAKSVDGSYIKRTPASAGINLELWGAALETLKPFMTAFSGPDGKKKWEETGVPRKGVIHGWTGMRAVILPVMSWLSSKKMTEEQRSCSGWNLDIAGQLRVVFPNVEKGDFTCKSDASATKHAPAVEAAAKIVKETTSRSTRTGTCSASNAGTTAIHRTRYQEYAEYCMKVAKAEAALNAVKSRAKAAKARAR